MVALASPLADRFGRFLPSPVATAAGATISAQLGVTPILLYHFHEVPLVTLPANLAAFPLVAPSLLLGAVAAGTGLVWFPLGRHRGSRRAPAYALAWSSSRTISARLRSAT